MRRILLEFELGSTTTDVLCGDCRYTFHKGWYGTKEWYECTKFEKLITMKLRKAEGITPSRCKECIDAERRWDKYQKNWNNWFDGKGGCIVCGDPTGCHCGQ